MTEGALRALYERELVGVIAPTTRAIAGRWLLAWPVGLGVAALALPLLWRLVLPATPFDAGIAAGYRALADGLLNDRGPSGTAVLILAPIAAALGLVAALVVRHAFDPGHAARNKAYVGKRLVKLMLPGAVYKPRAHLSDADANRSGVVGPASNATNGEDLVVGTLNGRRFVLSELRRSHLHLETRRGKTSLDAHTDFTGVLIRVACGAASADFRWTRAAELAGSPFPPAQAAALAALGDFDDAVHVRLDGRHAWASLRGMTVVRRAHFRQSFPELVRAYGELGRVMQVVEALASEPFQTENPPDPKAQGVPS